MSSSSEQQAEDYLLQLANSGYNMPPTPPDFWALEEIVTAVYARAKQIRSILEQCGYTAAQRELDELLKMVGCLPKSETAQSPTLNPAPVPSKAPSPLFSECIAQFVKSKAQGSEKWTAKTVETNERNFKTILALIGDLSINEINGRVLDEALGLALDMPKRNKRPYNKLTIQECMGLAKNNQVNEDDFVTAKTVKELKSLLQGLYAFLRRTGGRATTRQLFCQVDQ